MNAIWNALVEPWTHAYFVKGVLGGSILAAACAVLGCYIVLRRMAFIGDAMSHALLPGVGVGYLVMNALLPGGFTSGGLLIGALVAAVLTSVSISALSRVKRISEDTSIGIVYTGLFASGIVILTRFQQYINIDLNHFFQGDIYGVSWEDMWMGAGAAGVVLSLIILFYRYFTIVSFDPVMAASLGFPTGLIHIALTGMIALICVAGISMVGVIMIVGLLITPAALAYMFTDRLPRMMLLAAFFGVLSVVLGLYFSEWVNASGGGAIMFTGFLLFLAGLLSAPRYGVLANWWRRRTLVPQSDIEDLLKAALEDLDVRLLPIPSGRIRRGVHRLIRDGLVMAMTADGRLHLAEAGHREAAHIERSHQLWEGHLMSRGMKADAAHAAAERLEHLHDRRVLDEFDNELDHPGVDAHGIPIPGEQEAHSERVAPLRLSLMRQGDRGRVQGGKTVAGLPPGTVFRLQGRDPLSGDWIVHPDDSECLRVPHDDADEVTVDICD